MTVVSIACWFEAGSNAAKQILAKCPAETQCNVKAYGAGRIGSFQITKVRSLNATAKQDDTIEGKDLLLLIVEDDSGKRSVHNQFHLQLDDCIEFLANFKKLTSQNKPTTLEIEGPIKVTGRVVAAYCVRPNDFIERP